MRVENEIDRPEDFLPRGCTKSGLGRMGNLHHNRQSVKNAFQSGPVSQDHILTPLLSAASILALSSLCSQQW